MLGGARAIRGPGAVETSATKVRTAKMVDFMIIVVEGCLKVG